MAQPQRKPNAKPGTAVGGVSGLPIMQGGYEYHLLRELGAGGMAKVYLAKRRKRGEPEEFVAIKSLLPAFLEVPEVRMMFEYEANVCRQLHHPNIVRTDALIRQGDELYMVMELIQGKNLNQLALKLRERDRQVPLRCALVVMSDVARGLAYAHSKVDERTGNPLNLVHRDVSPRNIMISDEGHAKLLDFGIAKAKGRAKITQAGFTRGTRDYSSPEQLAGKEADHRSDIFSVGMVLQELIGVTDIFAAVSKSGDSSGGFTAVQAPVNGATNDPTQDALRICARCAAPALDERFSETALLVRELDNLLEKSGGLADARDELVGYMKELFPAVESIPDQIGNQEPTSFYAMRTDWKRRGRRRARRLFARLFFLGAVAFVGILLAVNLVLEGTVHFDKALPDKLTSYVVNPEETLSALQARYVELSRPLPSTHPAPPSPKKLHWQFGVKR